MSAPLPETHPLRLVYQAISQIQRALMEDARWAAGHVLCWGELSCLESAPHPPCAAKRSALAAGFEAMRILYDESLRADVRRASDPHPVPGPAEQWAAARGMIPPPDGWYARNGPDGRGFQSRAAVIRRGFAAVRQAAERHHPYVVVVEADTARAWTDAAPSISTTFRERRVEPTDDPCEVAAWLLATQGNIGLGARA